MKMKVITFSIICCAFLSCWNKSHKKANENINQVSQTNLIDSDSSANFDKVDLQGIWSESLNNNALFFIKGDSLRYVEYQDASYKIDLKNDSLFIFGEVEISCRIIKLNKDSLCYIDNITGSVTRLVKVK